MSPRIKILRKVSDPPLVKGFKPYGSDLRSNHLDCINLLYEEYEALRLSDYEGLNHRQAAEIMQVSRPTFTRIYASALRKIAKAFVEGRQISIEGGKVFFDSDWYNCKTCNCYFNNPNKENSINNCPLCKSQKIEKCDYEDLENDLIDDTYYDLCICPECGYEQKHYPGKQCKKQICPRCLTVMKRKVVTY